MKLSARLKRRTSQAWSPIQGPSTKLAELAFGFADRGHSVLNDIETRFAMASGSKIFTALAVGLLIQDGLVALETPLAECLQSRELPFASEVTVQQLLNHTSGIPDYFDEEGGSNFADLWRERPCYSMISIRDFLPLFVRMSMKFPPGTAFRYSNSGFIVLGLLIEELTGQNFCQFVADRIFKTCQMTKTGYFPMDAPQKKTAVGYLSSATSDHRTNIYSLPSIGGPDGGAFTTAGDLIRFWSALLAGRLLSMELVDRFTAPSIRVSDNDESRYYGYGVWLAKRAGDWIISTVGEDPGASMVSRVRRNDGHTLTVLSNVQDGARKLSRLLDPKIFGT